MRTARWLSIPLLGLGIVFLFFGILWTAVPQLLVGLVFSIAAAAVWRGTTGTWPSLPSSR